MFKVTRVIFILMPLFLSSFFVIGQGGRAAGLAHSAITLEDESAVFYNIAGTAKLKGISAVCAYSNRFGIESLNTYSAGVLAPIKFGVASIDVTRFGNSIYNESAIGLGFSHNIQNVSLGIKASYAQLYIEEYGTKGVLVLEFGGIAQIIPGLTFGAHIYNLNQAAYSKENDEKVPITMKAGLGFKPFDKVLLLIEIEKNLKYQTRFRGGLEYKIIKSLFLRTGISTHPIQSSFGFGLDLKRFKIDYGFGAYQRIGFQHSISLVASFKKHK
ncbi:MAG TPA: hypothetical protein VD908_02380 [Cytophagales bacterium]|nr:hypothetical protein [Cytophagales bacterium]